MENTVPFIHSTKRYILVSLFLAVILAPGPVYQAMAQDETTVPGGARVTAAADEENALIINIEGTAEAPGEVFIEYGADGVNPLRTVPVPTEEADFSVQLMRLQAETEYDYTVYLLEDGGEPALQYEGTFTTGPLPEGLQDAVFELIEGQATYPVTLLDFNDDDFAGIVAIDRDAEVVWYYEHDTWVYTIDRRDNGNLVFNELMDHQGNTMYEISPDGTALNSVDDVSENGTVCEWGRWHHEMILRPDNKAWTLGEEIRPVIIDGVERLQTGETIEEWDISGNTVTRLVSFFDLMDPAEIRTEFSDTTEGFFWKGCDNQYAGETEDWLHCNSINVTMEGEILISSRYLNQVFAISPDMSEIVWRLGGPESDFTFPDSSDKFWHQHTAQQLENGNILLFDNGNNRPEEEGGQYSRALELELDMETMEARKVWEYRHDPDLFAGCCSSVYRLENGNSVLVFGMDGGEDPPVFTLVEADPEGKAVSVIEISSPGKNIQYRAYPIDSINGESEAGG